MCVYCAKVLHYSSFLCILLGIWEIGAAIYSVQNHDLSLHCFTDGCGHSLWTLSPELHVEDD